MPWSMELAERPPLTAGAGWRDDNTLLRASSTRARLYHAPVKRGASQEPNAQLTANVVIPVDWRSPTATVVVTS